MKNARGVQKRILSLVREYCALVHRRGKFLPGESVISYGGRVFDHREMVNLVDSALEFWLTAGRYAQDFEERMAAYLGVKHCILSNSGSSANLLAVSALTSPKLGASRLKPGDEVTTRRRRLPDDRNSNPAKRADTRFR